MRVGISDALVEDFTQVDPVLEEVEKSTPAEAQPCPCSKMP